MRDQKISRQGDSMVTLWNFGSFCCFVTDASKSRFPGLPTATMTAINFLPSRNHVPVTSARCTIASTSRSERTEESILVSELRLPRCEIAEL